MRPEYRREDLGNGVRGKYFARYGKGTNLVLLKAKVSPCKTAVISPRPACGERGGGEE